MNIITHTARLVHPDSDFSIQFNWNDDEATGPIGEVYVTFYAGGLVDRHEKVTREVAQRMWELQIIEGYKRDKSC